MTDRTKFEAMLEALINEDQDTAKSLFHDIVVAKSRKIYEHLLADEFKADDEESEDDDFASDDADLEDDDEFASDETFDDEESEDDFDIEADDTESGFGDEDSEGDIEDRVLNLEDALDELKASFEELMAGEESEPEHDDMDFGSEDEFGSDEESDPFASDDLGAEPADTFGDEDDELQKMMEYVNKVALPKHGDNGVNTKSVIAKENNVGGTTANIARGGVANEGGTKGGLLSPTTEKLDAGNINVPGANAGKTAFKKKESGHGAEKKGAGEKAQNTKSLLGSK